MAIFGQHETVQRLHLSGVGGVHALKADEKKVIKVLQPPAGIWSEETIHQEIGGFIARAGLEQQLAKKSSNWAPIHEFGILRDDSAAESGAPVEPAAGEIPAGATGAFAIMDRYERSVQSLIDGRVNLTNDDMRNLMSGVMRGLIDISKDSVRQHGNLKPSNILLAHSQDLAAAAVYLADPAPEGLPTKKNAGKDLADLGKILFHLVNLRNYDGGLIAKSKDWTRLGPNGEDWRKLCNSLLDPQAPAEERDLERILPAVAQWTARPPRSKAPLLIAVSAVVILGGGGVAMWFFPHEKKLDFSQEKWEKLCLSEAQWFEKFSGEMTDPTVQKKYESDPNYPAGVAKAFEAVAKDLDKYSPEAISGESGRSPLHLAAQPTQAAMTGYGPNTTDKADRLIDSVTIALGPEQWPLLGQLDKTAKDYQERGWAGPAKQIEDLIASAKPPALPDAKTPIADRVNSLEDATPVDMGAVVNGTIAARKNVDIAEGARKQVLEDLAKLPQGDAQNIPLIKALPQFAQDYPAAAPNLTKLAGALSDLDGLLRNLRGALTPAGKQIDFADLAGDPAVKLPPGKLSMGSFEALPETVGKYEILADDPRKQTQWAEKLADVEKNEISFIQTANAADANLPKLQQADAQLKQMIGAWANIPAIESHRADLDKRVADAQGALKSLQDNASAWSAPYRIDPKVYLAQQRDRLTGTALAKATPVVYAAWREHQNTLIGELAAAGDAIKKNYHQFQDFDQKFNDTEKTFQQIDALIPASVPGLSAVGGNDWKHAIAARVATTDRESALGQIIAALKWSEDRPQTDDPAFVSARENVLKGYEQKRTDTLSLIADYAAITADLDRLELTAADTPAGGAAWRDLYARWMPAKNPLMSDREILAALQPINDRVGNLMAVEKQSDYKQLLTATESGAPEIVLTAWRNLGSAAISEDLPVLDDELAARGRVLAVLQRLQSQNLLDANRAAKFKAQIAAQQPVRWRRWAGTLTSAKNIEHALDLVGNGEGQFDVQLSAAGDPDLYYDQMLYNLRKQSEKNPTEAALKPMAQQFSDDVGKMAAGVKGNGNVQNLITRLGGAIKGSEQDSGSSKAGPALAGNNEWTMDAAASKPEGSVRVFKHTGTDGTTYTLEFLKVKGAGEEKGAYVCTSELSFGLFAQTVNGDNKARSDLNDTGKSGDDQHWFKPYSDTWDLGGPRVWKIDAGNGRFLLAPQWLSKFPEFPNPADLYPAGGAPPAPSDAMPMQYISPWSAMYVAQMLGCRLPTTAEWQAALGEDLHANPNGPKDAWNLRGKAFQTQQDYAKATVAKPQLDQMPYTDTGIFWPPRMEKPDIEFANAKPWNAADLAALPNLGRFSGGAGIYTAAGNEPVFWFRKVGSEPGKYAPGKGTGAMHDLIGNVGEYVFDGIPEIKDNKPSTTAIDALIAKGGVDKDGKKAANLFVIGGSALSPPQMPLDQPEPVNLRPGYSDEGYCDVGVRLAFTVPIATIAEVLEEEFKNPHYLTAAGGRRE